MMLLVTCFSTLSAQDHNISISGQLGWALPGGDGVGEEETDPYDVDGGLTYAADALYHFGDGKLRAGITYSAAILASVDSGLDAYGMSFYGLKGMYYLKNEGFSPFGGLSLGIAKLETPETSSGGQVINPSESGTSFAIQPTLGLAFGNFYISADYLLPSNIALDEDPFMREGKIGYLGINLGYRQPFSF